MGRAMGFGRRHYLVHDDGTVERIPERVINGMIHGHDALPEYAGRAIRNLFVALETVDGKPDRITYTEGAVLRFDTDGRIDRSLRDSLVEILNEVDGSTAPKSNVVPLAAKLHGGRRRRDYWEPTPSILEKVAADIWGADDAAGADRVRLLKGEAPKPPSISFEARNAVSELRSGVWRAMSALTDLSEHSLKGASFLLREAATDDPEVSAVLDAFAAAADRRREIKARHRRGNGVWVAIIDITEWEPGRRVGQQVQCVAQKHKGRDAAVAAARQMLAEHAILV